MPGVADASRRTKLIQEQIQRKKDMDEILKMVKEERLHEADSRQLEILRLIQELNGVGLAPPSSPSPLSEDRLAELVAAKVAEVLASSAGSNTFVSNSPSNTSERPSMKHVSIDLSQSPNDKVTISVDQLGEEKDGAGAQEAADKLEKLRKLRGK